VLKTQGNRKQGRIVSSSKNELNKKGEKMRKEEIDGEDKIDEDRLDEAYENIFNENYRKYLEEIIPQLNKTKITKLFKDINSVICSRDSVILPKEAMCVLSFTLASAVSLDKELSLSREKKE